MEKKTEAAIRLGGICKLKPVVYPAVVFGSKSFVMVPNPVRYGTVDTRIGDRPERRTAYSICFVSPEGGAASLVLFGGQWKGSHRK